MQGESSSPALQWSTSVRRRHSSNLLLQHRGPGSLNLEGFRVAVFGRKKRTLGMKICFLKSSVWLGRNWRVPLELSDHLLAKYPIVKANRSGLVIRCRHLRDDTNRQVSYIGANIRSPSTMCVSTKRIEDRQTRWIRLPRGQRQPRGQRRLGSCRKAFFKQCRNATCRSPVAWSTRGTSGRI